MSFSLSSPAFKEGAPAPRAGTSVLLQPLRARRAAEIAGRRHEAGRGGRDAGARVGNGPAHGDLREAEAVRALLVASVVTGMTLGAQGGRQGLAERLSIFGAKGDPVAHPAFPA